MKRLTTILLILISTAAWVWANENKNDPRDAKLIGQVKQIPVSQLDAALPSISFEKWLRVEAGADAELQWEVNDCGEQTGTAEDRDRDFPICVEVDAHMKDQRTIVVSVTVGTFKKGAFGKPAVFFAQLNTPHQTIDIRQLSDFPAELIRTRGASNPEIAK